VSYSLFDGLFPVLGEVGIDIPNDLFDRFDLLAACISLHVGKYDRQRLATEYGLAPSRVLVNLRFVRELDPALEMRSRSVASFFPSELFEAGDRVLHSVFGPGTIIAVDVKGSGYSIRFDNLPTNRNLRLGTKFEKI
jgi:hypothetical protein